MYIVNLPKGYSYVYPLRRNQDPAPRLHYCSLTAPPLSLHPLPSLISNGLNLPCWHSGEVMEAVVYSLQETGKHISGYMYMYG